MKAMPLAAGSASKSLLQASRPPAEAPIATIGKLARLLAEGAISTEPGRFAVDSMRTTSRHSTIFLEGDAAGQRTEMNSKTRSRLRPIQR